MNDDETVNRVLQILATGMDDLVVSRAALREPSDDDDAESEVLRAGIDVIRRFYQAFFRGLYQVEVMGFGWEDKRRAVEGILKNHPYRPEPAASRVAALFEGLSDALHGDLEFGYTDDVDAMRRFISEYLVPWADGVFRWLESARANEVSALRLRFDDTSGNIG